MIEALAGIAVLFFLYLILQRWIRLCAICLASATVWVVLLTLTWAGIYEDAILVALLIGMSALGTYYLFEKNAPERLHMFRLPLLLTLIFAGYSLLGIPDDILPSLFFLSALWAAFGTIYAYRNSKAFSGLIERLIACCRDW